ncbi:TIGR02281 family clan AA aspartic protease [uncultured Thiohalocapsa sp.]|uniref:retropepsin-like aspartic protease family protein n=1 Tax=uncultured Thiohalocapsa sp. TaxID=768990 RepID=UPI0025FC4FEE|nr:retropepsin-like aspartic protease [uncultured Thiohalocapsa sp.]
MQRFSFRQRSRQTRLRAKSPAQLPAQGLTRLSALLFVVSMGWSAPLPAATPAPAAPPETPEARQVAVAAELARLAADYGFTVTGDEHLAESTGRAESVADPVRRLRTLLEGFDHIIVQDGRGGVERVIVMGATAPGATSAEPLVAVDGGPPPDAPIELPTIRQGSQHSVRVALEGADGRRLARVLLIDTGADTVVLPDSLIEDLGLDEDGLQEREVQTANGMTQALTGRLDAVWLGAQRVTDVAVAFLDDDKLGNAGLLGMSVLGRYQLTIDDQENRLTLSGR